MINSGVNGIMDKTTTVIKQLIRKSRLAARIGCNNKNIYPRVVPKKFIPSSNPTNIVTYAYLGKLIKIQALHSLIF